MTNGKLKMNANFGKVVIRIFDHWEWTGKEDIYPMTRRWPAAIANNVVSATPSTSVDLSRSFITFAGDKCEIHHFNGSVEEPKLHSGNSEDVGTSLAIIGGKNDLDNLVYFFRYHVQRKIGKGKVTELQLHRYYDCEEDVYSDKQSKAELRIGRHKVDLSYGICKPVIDIKRDVA